MPIKPVTRAPRPRPLLKLRDRIVHNIAKRTPAGYVSPKLRRSYKPFLASVDQQFESLPVRVVFTDQDPYGPNSRAMKREVRKTGVLKIWTGSTEGHPIMTHEQTIKMRAVHDYYGHIVPDTTFSRVGEHQAYLSHSKMFPRKARRALAAETEAFAAFYGVEGRFMEQKSVDLPWVLR